MLDSLFAPGSLQRVVAELILERAAKGRWMTTSEVMRQTGASRKIVDVVRKRLRDAGLLDWKAAYSRWGHRRRAPSLALALLLALATTTTTTTTAGAIRAGEERARPAASWWLIGPCATPPRVEVVGGEGGAHCAPDGGPGVVWAQGDWAQVRLNGDWFAGAGQIRLVQVWR